MMLFLKKKTDEASKSDAPAPAIAAASATHNNAYEFIPYDCHITPHTLLTKNGEVLQTIKIASNTSGLDYEGGNTDESMSDINVREIIRRSLLGNVNSDKFSFWIHTMRKRKDISYSSPVDDGFDSYVHDRWQQKNAWKYQYYNEVYVTVLFDGQGADLIDKKHMKDVVLPLQNRELRNKYIDDANDALDSLVARIMDNIRPYYNVQRLAITERIPDSSEIALSQPIFYSEPMEFLGTLLNMHVSQYPLPERDLGLALSTHALTFGFNALETRDNHGKRRFGALLSLKQYRELSPDTLDRIMQAPTEFIITQSFNFIPAAEALKPIQEQREMFEMSEAMDCMEASGITELIRSNKKNPTDYCQYQTMITVMVDEYKLLDSEVAKMQSLFSGVGLITIREDIRLEECFWSQLPGNFEFIRRKEIINTQRIGGFCRLNRFPNGVEKSNHWGDAVTLMPTMVNSPYFFNFHVQDNGHSVVFDFNSFNDHAGNTLLNFLLSETRKYNGRMYVFDRFHSAELFFHKLGADYHQFPEARPSYMQGQAENKLSLNPFILEASPRNMAFLLAWCTTLISPDEPLDAERKEYLRSAIEKTYGNPPEERNMVHLVNHLAEMDMYMAQEFVRLNHDAIYNGLIGSEENLDLSHPVHGFEMGSVIQHKERIIPVFSYLMHRIITSLDGRPTIIVMHEAWDLLENSFFAPRLESLLEMLQQNNVMVIFTTRKPFQCTELTTFSTIMQKCQTRLYIPDDINHHYVSPKLGLNENDKRIMLRMERQNGNFLLKQKNESIALQVDFRDLEDIYSIMCNDAKSLSAAGGKYVKDKKAAGKKETKK
jgi:type IV secretion system protein VirB4